jgi:hypothetical protein
VDAGDRVGAEREAAEGPAEDRLDPGEGLGLDRVGQEPHTVTLEFGEQAAKAEVTQARSRHDEQLVPRLGSCEAAAERREGAQRPPYGIALRRFLVHPNAGSTARAAGPMTSMSQAEINGG